MATLNGMSGSETISGTTSSDNINAGAGDDTVYAGDGNDKVSGGNGEDEIYGGTGSDNLDGGTGDDTLDGDAGSDTVHGGVGNDILIYDLSENAWFDSSGVISGSYIDRYQGGSGYDTVRFEVSLAEWTNNPAFRADVVAYQNFVNARLHQGEIGQQFTFGSVNLTLQQLEKIEVYVGPDLINVLGNDAPQGTNNTVTTNEDTSYTFTAGDFGFTDVFDVPANNFAAVKISSLPGNGTLLYNNVAITSAQVAAGFYVSVADINDGKLKFVPDADENGTGYASFTFQVQDDGGTAGGGQDTDQSPNTVTINVAAVNDAPVNTVPGTQSATEDQPHVITGLSISDVDAAASNVTTTLAVASGTLTVATVVGGAAVSGSGTGSVVLTGTVSEINTTLAALNAVSYQGNLNFNGADTLTVTTNDGGATGSGGAQSDTDLVTINVAAVNDAPVLTGDLAATMDEGATYIITTSDLNFTDPDDNAAGVTFSITSPTNGVIQVNGVTATSFTGTQLAAGQVTFVHDSSETLSAGFDVSVEDGDEDSSTPVAQPFAITVNPVNDSDPNDNDSLATASAPVIMTAGQEGAQTIAGSNGNDTLYGGSGNDFFYGGGGDDIIYGYFSGGPVSGQDGDQIYGGSGNDQLHGDQRDDTIYGGSGNDSIWGNAGDDSLWGGLGQDIFVFDAPADSKDTINDFSVVDDTIWLSSSGFGFAYTGALNASQFVVGSSALDANDRIIYNSTTGDLIFDSNGNASGGQTVIAVLGTGLSLTASDINLF